MTNSIINLLIILSSMLYLGCFDSSSTTKKKSRNTVIAPYIQKKDTMSLNIFDIKPFIGEWRPYWHVRGKIYSTDTPLIHQYTSSPIFLKANSFQTVGYKCDSIKYISSEAMFDFYINDFAKKYADNDIKIPTIQLFNKKNKICDFFYIINPDTIVYCYNGIYLFYNKSDNKKMINTDTLHCKEDNK